MQDNIAKYVDKTPYVDFWDITRPVEDNNEECAEVQSELEETYSRCEKELEKAIENNPVSHPSHYTFGNIEVIDYIKDKLTFEQYKGYLMGNVIKYVSRWEHKGGVQDLEKAKVYNNWLIELVKSK